MATDRSLEAGPLLEVRGLQIIFQLPEGTARAVDSLDLQLQPGEVVGLVGESGSGKTVTALSILGLIQPPGIVSAQGLTFDGIDLMSLSDEQWSTIRGVRIAGSHTCRGPATGAGLFGERVAAHCRYRRH